MLNQSNEFYSGKWVILIQTNAYTNKTCNYQNMVLNSTNVKLKNY